MPGALTHKGKLLGLVVLLLVFLMLALLWRCSALSEVLTLERLARWTTAVQTNMWAPVVGVGVFVVGGLVVFPVTVLILQFGILFGPLWGSVYAVVGMLLSAATTYGAGFALGRESVQRFAGPKLNRISRALAKRGVLTIAAIRVVPIAPFSVVNVVAGASHIRFFDYMLGTVIGMVPGTILLAVLGNRILEAFRDPSLTTAAVAGGIVAAMAVVSIILSKIIEEER